MAWNVDIFPHKCHYTRASSKATDVVVRGGSALSKICVRAYKQGYCTRRLVVNVASNLCRK